MPTAAPPERAPAPSAADVRHGQYLDHEQLRLAAVEAVEAEAERDPGFTRLSLADRLEVSSGAITRALSPNEPPGTFSALQMRIVEELTGYAVRDVTKPRYRVERKARRGAPGRG